MNGYMVEKKAPITRLIMTEQDHKELSKALALLHDFISNHGARAEDYKVLNDAEDILRGWESTH
jgi:hypothetical protein